MTRKDFQRDLQAHAKRIRDTAAAAQAALTPVTIRWTTETGEARELHCLADFKKNGNSKRITATFGDGRQTFFFLYPEGRGLATTADCTGYNDATWSPRAEV